MKKKYYQNLEELRNKIRISSLIENTEINYVLKWLRKKNLSNKMQVKKINVKELKDWLHLYSDHPMSDKIWKYGLKL